MLGRVAGIVKPKVRQDFQGLSEKTWTMSKELLEALADKAAVWAKEAGEFIEKMNAGLSKRKKPHRLQGLTVTGSFSIKNSG